MDELPELLVEAVSDATVIETVDLGGGDYVAVARGETYLYRSEGLLADESLETFTHDVDRFGVNAGRRKSSIRLDAVDDELTFAVPSKVTDAVVEAMLEGILRTTGVIAPEETVEAQFRFSELTLVVTDEQLLKHVGNAVWDDEHEAFRYEDLTGLDFEEGSVATQVVFEMDSRQQRVKVPNDYAGRVRQEIQAAVFEYHGVSSLGGLRAKFEPEDEPDETDDEAEEADAVESSSNPDSADSFVSADWSPPADQDVTSSTSRGETEDEHVTSDGVSTTDGVATEPDETPEIEALAEQVDSLAEQVEHQTELIESQQETIEQLIEELRRGR